MKIAVGVAIGCFLLGCSSQHQIKFSNFGLPEEIFTQPSSNRYDNAKVAVFKFATPHSASTVGAKAAKILCQELLKNKVFANVYLEVNESDINQRDLIDIARAKNYNLIITGEMLYYLEGSDFHESSIKQEIQVFRISGNTTKLLWWAMAKEKDQPVPSRDYVFFRSKGSPALSTEGLMRRNAEKFAKMLDSQ